MGSRLWGTHHSKSDYDWYVVCHQGQAMTHGFSGDLTVLDEQEWLAKVEQGEFIATVCLFLPDSHVLKGLSELNRLRSSLKLEVDQVRAGLDYRLERDCEYIAKNQSKGKMSRAAKTKRHLAITEQIGERILEVLKGGSPTPRALDLRYLDPAGGWTELSSSSLELYRHAKELGSAQGSQVARAFILANLARLTQDLKPKQLERVATILNLPLYDTGGEHSHRPTYYYVEAGVLKQHQLPRNFSRVKVAATGRQIWGSSLPVNELDFKVFRQLGIKQVLTVMEEPNKTTQDHLPIHLLEVVDQTPPSLEQMHQAMQLIDSSESTLVHCYGGVGRTATVIIGYLMWFEQISLAEARIRLNHRKTILSKSQERFLTEWYKHCFEPRARVRLPPLIMLIGLPGSGKSTFAQALSRLSQVTVISPDQNRAAGLSKDAGYQQLATAIKKPNTVTILYRCNPTRAERKEWLEAAFKPRCWAVWFDISAEECQWRAAQRTDHPTLDASRSARVIEGFARQFQVPEDDEPGFERVFRLDTIASANNLLTEWGVAPPKPSFADNYITKFPRTKHFFNLGAASRDDLLLSPAQQQEFLNCPIYLEEKIDGANLGISLNQNNQLVVQNRSHYVNSKSHSQFKKLDNWLNQHQTDLWHVLTEGDAQPGQLILYGEWVYAQHSIGYQQLPDYFIAFDLYDKLEQRFWSRERLSQLLAQTGLHQIKLLARQSFSTPEQIAQYARTQKSDYYDGLVEGVYLRKCGQRWLQTRSKVVRADFLSGNEHWSKGMITVNRLALE